VSAPRLLAISDRNLLGVTGWSAWCASLGAAGVPALQVREKDLDDRSRVDLARAAREALPATTLVVLNGRADLARAAGAQGVHLPGDGLPVAAARRVAPAPWLVGRSTHSLEQVESARDEGADYVVFGPVFETPSKAGRLAPRGLEELAAAARTGIPVLALGGLDEGERFDAALAAGAWGIAGVRAFVDPARAAALVRRLREAEAAR
jgi:thiamine-phosphate pyrophosphorylase